MQRRRMVEGPELPSISERSAKQTRAYVEESAKLGRHPSVSER
jgi:hypothetical protein